MTTRMHTWRGPGGPRRRDDAGSRRGRRGTWRGRDVAGTCSETGQVHVGNRQGTSGSAGEVGDLERRGHLGGRERDNRGVNHAAGDGVAPQ